MKFFLQKTLNKFIYRPLIKRKLNKAGCNFRLGYYSEVINPKFFTIGDHFYSGPFSYLGTNKNYPVEIGDYVMFGPKCTIQGGNHDMAYEGFMYKNQDLGHMSGIIKIENGAWIGANSTMLSGTEIGEGSIIGAMSLINKKIPPFVVAAGVPVKVIKPRFKTISQLKNTMSITKSKYELEDVLNLHKSLGFSYE